MPTPMVRGYWLLRSFSYLDERFGLAAGAQARERLPREVQVAVESLAPGDWCPRDYLVEVLHTVARAGGARGEEALVGCGEAIARAAYESFLKPALDIMTPALFFKKLGTIWDIDHQNGGRVAVAMPPPASGAGRARFLLESVTGFDHLAPTFSGWTVLALTKLKLVRPGAEYGEWTTAAPASDTVTYEVTWS